jgi:hypothetical protein
MNKIVYNLAVISIIGIFLAANTLKLKYTPYQILVWELKANEGYSSTWYKDGIVRGRQAYSIGFGWNDQGNRRRHEIKEYLTDGRISYNEATAITVRELKKYGKLHSDPYKNLALQLYSYNCGLTKSGSSLGKCCHASKGCGSSNKNIRKSHNRRRKMELALWNHNFQYVEQITEENKLKVSKSYEK